MNAKTSSEPTRTLSVPKAGEIYFGIGRGASYAAAANGQIPTIKIGKLLRVPIAAMEKLLANAGGITPK